ncbi:MAG TPA: hypothetical protein VH986_06575 [Acidimicrobiia bacterium]|jgi:hypothetical protein
MESPEGRGIARRAWESYRKRARKLLMPLVRPIGVKGACDLVGFWLVWQLHGGYEGLRDLGMPQSTIYWKIKRFRTVYGVHPDEFVIPGVELDPAKYWQGSKS